MRRLLALLPAVVVGGSLWACGPDPLTATDVAEAAGIARVIDTHGENCLFDYDRDGHFDLFLSTHGTAAWQLFRSNGDGTFTETNVGRFVRRDRHGCATGDFNGDGRPDIYASIGACMGTCPVEYPKELWIQQPDGTFVDQAAAYGVTDPHGRGREPVAFDVNNDGGVDLFTGQEIGVDYPSPNRLYTNLWGTTLLATSGPPNEEIGANCVSVGDYDGDGFDDLIVCGTSTLRLYRNNGGTGFTNSSAAANLPIVTHRDAEFAHMNGDGLIDLVLTQRLRVEVRLNGGDGRFPMVNWSTTLEEGRDVAVGDVDGDGDRDLFVSQGVNADFADRLYLNNGTGGGFTSFGGLPRVTFGNGDEAQAIPNWKGSGRAAILVNNGGTPAGAGPRQLIEFTVNE